MMNDMLSYPSAMIGLLLATALGNAAAPATPGIAAPSPPASSPAPIAPPSGMARAKAAPAPQKTSPVHPLHASATAFGARMDVEVRDLPRDPADAAIQAAFAEAALVERMTDPARPDSEVAALNAAAGKGPRHVDSRLFQALARALDFCQWSDGKQGPLARDIHHLWGRGSDTPLAGPPSADDLGRAIAAAACGHLTIDAGRQTAALDAGSGLDLVDFRRGMAVDRAIVVLRQHGSANALVQIGPLRRGIGGGRAGLGWAVDLPAFGGLQDPLSRILLRDQSLAIATRDDHPLRVGTEALPPFINQRSGQPAEGIVAILAVTDLAIDAQALAATMAITSTQEGTLLMGSIRPRPSILWLMGSGSGAPLLVDYRWTEVAKR